MFIIDARALDNLAGALFFQGGQRLSILLARSVLCHHRPPFNPLFTVPSIMNTSTPPSPSPAPAKGSPARSTASAGTKRKRTAGSKYYAVKAGFQPGVYYNWNECLLQVTGFKGAVCKFAPRDQVGWNSFPRQLPLVYTDDRPR
jgi:Caulimovirus viroplasmin